MNLIQAINPTQRQNLQNALEQATQDTNTPDIGVSISVVTPESKWIGATGVSNLDTQKVTQPDDLFNIASTTKAYISATILKLQEKGKLSLDDTLDQWLPEIATQITLGEHLTIRQLLNGTGGVPDYTDSETFVSDSFAEYLSGSTRDLHPEELVAYVFGKPLFSGSLSTEQWTYPNTGYIIAALIAEKASGKPFEQILNEEILEPLGLKNTFFSSQDVSSEKRAIGYADLLMADGTPGQDGILEDYRSANTEWAYGSGSMVSSAEDVAIFYNALASGSLLSPEATAEIVNYVDIGINEFTDIEQFGLGVYPTKLPWGETISMDGGFHGYRADVNHFLNSETTISVLTNRGWTANDRSSLLFQAYKASIAHALGLNDGSVFNGTGVDDDLRGTSNNNVINGFEGHDTLVGQRGLDALDGGKGDDFLDGGEADDHLFGRDGDDTLYGGLDNDFLNGGRGDDLLDGGQGNDFLIGGDGQDIINGGEGDDNLSGGEGDDILTDTQGNNSFYGNDGDDWLFAGQGNDALYGDAGNDIILAQTGNDQLFGGIGDDYLNGGQGNDTLLGGEGHDLLAGLSGNDTLRGDVGNDTLIGGSANDILHGGMGNDTLRGDTGADQFLLSHGEDIIQDFQDGVDRLELLPFNGISLNFDDLEIVQIGKGTEIRWEFTRAEGAGDKVNVTILQGIQVNQITVNDFV